MKLSRKTAVAQEFSYGDARMAVLLLCGLYGVPEQELSTLLNVSDAQVKKAMAGDSRVVQKQAQDYDTSVKATYSTSFKPKDFTRLATYFGKLEGIDAGFITPGAMIAHAQAHWPDEPWVRTNYRTQDEEAARQAALGKLPHYKKAAQLVVQVLDIPPSRLAPDYPQLGAYLDSKAAAHALSDDAKLNLLRGLVDAVAAREHRSDLTLDQLLTDMTDAFPEAFHDLPEPSPARSGRSR